VKVLLLEDRLDVAEVVIDELRERGHHVDHCPTVADARSHYDYRGSSWWHLMILDYELPDGTGLDFLAGIRGSDRAKTILFSGDDRSRDLRKADLSVDYSVTKDRLPELLVAVDEVAAGVTL
jgi:DNA-binding response OmpR family regulator